MADNGLRAYYLGIYQELNKSMTIARELVKRALPFENEVKNLIGEISEIRKKLDKIFSHLALYRICSECHKSNLGGCCLKTDSHIHWRDAIYLVSKNLELELPHPDIELLISLKKSSCLFLGSNGCLLKEDRPTLCLEHICFELLLGIKKLTGEGVLAENQMAKLSAELVKKTRLLFIQIMSKNKLYSFGNPLEDYGLLQIINSHDFIRKIKLHL